MSTTEEVWVIQAFDGYYPVGGTGDFVWVGTSREDGLALHAETVKTRPEEPPQRYGPQWRWLNCDYIYLTRVWPESEDDDDDGVDLNRKQRNL